MTDKLKCPFCEAELRIDNIGFYVCPTVHCALWECEGVPQKVIKSLISGKKAQDALKEIVANPHGAACHNYCRAKRVLEEIGEITSITKQEI